MSSRHLLSVAAVAVVFVQQEAFAQMTHIETVNLNETVDNADALDINRHFGEIYVTDFNMLGRPLHVYDLDFNHLRDMNIGPPDYGVSEGVLRDPASGDFFFTTEDGTIRRYDSTGTFVSSFAVGGAGNGLAYDSSDGTLWVAHWDTEIVEHRTLDGTLISSFNPPDIGSIVGIATDPVSQTLFVSLNSADEVFEYTRDGAFIQIVLSGDPYGPGNGLGIAYDCVTGRLYYGGGSPFVLVFEDPSRPTCPEAVPCPWDLDGDGNVGVVDLLMLIASWGPCEDCPADFDGDGFVGIWDFLVMLHNFGPCPGPGCPWDVNGDGVVDPSDLWAVLMNFGQCEDCPEDVNGDGVVDFEDAIAVATHFGPCP